VPRVADGWCATDRVLNFDVSFAREKYEVERRPKKCQSFVFPFWTWLTDYYTERYGYSQISLQSAMCSSDKSSTHSRVDISAEPAWSSDVRTTKVSH
jgi:hypothetical protein